MRNDTPINVDVVVDVRRISAIGGLIMVGGGQRDQSPKITETRLRCL